MCHVREVMRLKATGVSVREIGRRVGAVPSTVRLTIRSVRSGRAELAACGRRHGYGSGGAAVCRCRSQTRPEAAGGAGLGPFIASSSASM